MIDIIKRICIDCKQGRAIIYKRRILYTSDNNEYFHAPSGQSKELILCPASLLWWAKEELEK